MAKKTLFSFELEPGMVVFEDVLDSSGRLVLAKGTTLDSEIISKLEFFAISEVPIDDAVNQISPKAEIIPEKSYTEKVKSSPEYRHFNADYNDILNLVKSNLDNLVNNGTPVDKTSLSKAIFCLIKDCKNTIQIFDIIYNLEPTDEAIYHHSLNVAVISVILGSWLGYKRDVLERLAVAAILHDIGKLTIPRGILNKSGRLTDEEFDIVKKHVNNGYNILINHAMGSDIADTALMHHERCDGSGYPFHYTLEQIPSFAKIVAIADVYDAMISSRSYRTGMCPFDVLQIFDSEGLYKYDPQYIMTFMENIASAYLHNNVLLSDGRTGEIIMIQRSCLHKPIIKSGNSFINLMKENNLKIEQIL
ncbi:MAG: HD-GYP domain-containing protein [Butyrivibrio sp.]